MTGFGIVAKKKKKKVKTFIEEVTTEKNRNSKVAIVENGRKWFPS